MKQFDLKSLGVQELNEQEMTNISGGNVFEDVCEWIGEAATDAWEWIQEHVRFSFLPSGKTL